MADKQPINGIWTLLGIVGFVALLMISVAVLYPARLRFERQKEFYNRTKAELESKEKKKGKGKGKRIAKAKVPKFTEVIFRRDVNTMHFYIPEEKKYAIDIKYDAKGANWVSFILVAVVSIVACAFLCFALPDLIKMIDNVITVVGTQS